MKILEVKDVSKKYGKKQVLSGVSFDIEEGDMFGLIGPNGAGKSTLINIITGILDPLNGEVLIGGHSIKKKAYRSKKADRPSPSRTCLIGRHIGNRQPQFFCKPIRPFRKKIKRGCK